MAYDIAILGDEAQGLSLLDFNNKVVEGGYKLVQQVVILMFTDETEPLSFGMGTQLPGFLAGSNNYDESVINNQFTINLYSPNDFEFFYKTAKTSIFMTIAGIELTAILD